MQVRDWYVESFRELRQFPNVRDAHDELKLTDLLRHIYRRHANVVPVMAKGVAELKRELSERAALTEMPEIHQFLDGFYLSRIGIRILIGEPCTYSSLQWAFQLLSAVDVAAVQLVSAY